MKHGYITPKVASVKSLLKMLVGDDLAVNDENIENGVSLADDRYIATFIDDEDKLVVLCSCNREFVVYSGAALSMVPVNTAHDQVKDKGDLPQSVLDNFYEVMNICSKLLMSDSSAHLRLDRILTPANAAEEMAAIDKPQTISFEVDVPNYGAGSLAFVA